MLLAIFNQFDTDNSGFITKDNIVNAMIKLGHQVDKKEVQSIMAEHDITGDNQISFKEFKQIFEIEERLHNKQ
jgi:Ca2+-binding EF-hand superfamily protein